MKYLLIIYLIGYIITFFGLIHGTCFGIYGQKINKKDIINFIIFSFLSWIAILLFIITRILFLYLIIRDNI